MARIQIKDLQVAEKELTQQEMGGVVGGAIHFQRWSQSRYQVQYRYIRRGNRMYVQHNVVRYERHNVSAFGTNFGNWHRA